MKHFSITILILLFCFSTAFGGTIVMTLTDYATGNTAVYDTGNGTFSDNVLPHHHDAYAKTDGDYLYIIEAMGADNIIKYDPSEISEGKEIYQYSVGENANPHDIVFVGSKAYVILYGSDKIWIVNPNAADEASFKTGEIDISAWADTDGSPDAHLAFVYDGMVYVVLQMYDLTSWTYGTPVLIKIDPATDTIVDMDSTTEGIQGVELIIKNPQKGTLLGSALYLGGTTYGTSDEGVMVVDLNDPAGSQVKLISEETAGGNVGGVNVFSEDYGIVYVFDANWNVIPYSFNPQDGALGEALPVPDAGGGVVMVNDSLYVGSRDYSGPGMYIVDPVSNTVVGERFPTELPPYAIVYVESGDPTEVAESEEAPEEIVLEAAYPNPFNPSTTVSFNLANANNVRIDVFNATGQKVHTLVNSFMSAGIHAVVWNALGMSTGIYYINVSAGISSQTAKIMLIK